jgi:valyl-tRNA synthetase
MKSRHERELLNELDHLVMLVSNNRYLERVPEETVEKTKQKIKEIEEKLEKLK